MGCPFFRHTQISWMNVPIPCIPWFFQTVARSMINHEWLFVSISLFLNLCTQQFLSPSFLVIDAPTWTVKTCQSTSRLCVRWCPMFEPQPFGPNDFWLMFAFVIPCSRHFGCFQSQFWWTPILSYSEIPTFHGECQVVHCFNPNCSICFHDWLLLNDIPNVIFTMKPMDFPHVFHIVPNFSTFFHHVHPPFWWFLHELTMLTTGVGASRAFRACQTGSLGGCREHSDARRMATSGMRRFSLWKIHQSRW